MSFSEGDKILARHPVFKDFHSGILKAVTKRDCLVLFQVDNSEYPVNIKNIKMNSSRTYRKSPARTKSPARSKSASRTTAPKTPPKPERSDKSPTKSKSPQRRRSPARTNKSPTRNKSPGRGKSPSRKEKTNVTEKPEKGSPKKVTKSSKTKEQEKQSSRTRIDSNIEVESETERDLFVNRLRGSSRKRSEDEKQTARVSPLNTINGMAERVGASIGVMTRRALRSNSQNKDADKIMRYQDPLDSLYKTEFSDSDELPVPLETLRSSRHKSKTPLIEKDRLPSIKVEKEFGGVLGTLFFSLLIITGPIFLSLWCTKDSCNYSKLPNLKILLQSNWKQYFDLDVALYYTGFHLLHALFFFLPFGGRVVDGPMFKYGKMKHRANGLFATVIITILVFILEYCKYPVLDLLYKKQLQFLIFAIIFGVVHSILLFIRSYFVPLGSLNVQASTNSRYYNFFMGREIRPIIAGYIDDKQLLWRTLNHLPVLIYISYLTRSLGSVSPFDVTLQNATVKPTLILLCLLQCAFFMDGILFEHNYLSSFEMQSEGVGFMGCVGYAIWPFAITLIGKYVLEHNIEHPLWYLAIILIVDIVGIIIYRGSNTQKHEFRQNPFNPALAHFETIPTPQGKKLLVSGYWGVVRHPNYTGDLLFELAWFLFAPTCPAALVTLPFATTLLVHRAIRDNARCKQKYGTAWSRYCERVKYILIPKIF